MNQNRGSDIHSNDKGFVKLHLTTDGDIFETSKAMFFATDVTGFNESVEWNVNDQKDKHLGWSVRLKHINDYDESCLLTDEEYELVRDYLLVMHKAKTIYLQKDNIKDVCKTLMNQAQKEPTDELSTH